jgi:hypothetical protein
MKSSEAASDVFEGVAARCLYRSKRESGGDNGRGLLERPMCILDLLGEGETSDLPGKGLDFLYTMR